MYIKIAPHTLELRPRPSFKKFNVYFLGICFSTTFQTSLWQTQCNSSSIVSFFKQTKQLETQTRTTLFQSHVCEYRCLFEWKYQKNGEILCLTGFFSPSLIKTTKATRSQIQVGTGFQTNGAQVAWHLTQSPKILASMIKESPSNPKYGGPCKNWCRSNSRSAKRVGTQVLQGNGQRTLASRGLSSGSPPKTLKVAGNQRHSNELLRADT